VRRKDREIASIDGILGILGANKVCRLGLCLDGKPYVIPLNYGFGYVDGKLSIYFHSAKTGLKIDMIEKSPSACFEIDCSHKLIEGEEACSYGFAYESVIAFGKARLCLDRESKAYGLGKLMENQAPEAPSTYPDSQLDKVAVIVLEVDEVSGKRHL
jgi:nitroimidazol reductase NimA-like FMN-containing flavoprotein (pyridoxamine 5'-phosphate oxidase superfamily)